MIITHTFKISVFFVKFHNFNVIIFPFKSPSNLGKVASGLVAQENLQMRTALMEVENLATRRVAPWTMKV